MDFGGLKLAHFPLDQQEGQFDLTLQVVDQRSLAIQFRYNQDLFNEQTIAALSRHSVFLLETIVADPLQTLGRAALLPKTKRDPLLRRAATSGAAASSEQTLTERFQAQVGSSPNAIAATCDGQHLSYGDLNRRANRLAHRLRELGVARDTLVGL